MSLYILAQIVAEATAFAELSGNDVIDPDSAVRHLESITAILRELSKSDRIALAEHLVRLAEKEPNNPTRAQFLRESPSYLGLLD